MNASFVVYNVPKTRCNSHDTISVRRGSCVVSTSTTHVTFREERDSITMWKNGVNFRENHGQPTRIRGLDALRGGAIAAVFVYHATPTQGIEQGYGELALFVRSFLWTGVDLFFVLSGFLITRILLTTSGSDRYFRTFYARRMLRIFPLYYLFVAISLFAPLLLSTVSPRFQSLVDGDDYRRLWFGQAWLWLYLQNFAQATGPSRLPGMGHLWSLAVEEQYYLVWPLLVRHARRRLLPLIGVALVLVVASRIVVSFAGVSPWAIMHLTFFRLDGLLIGSGVAVLGQNAHQNRIATKCRRKVMIVAVVVIVAVSSSRGTFDWTDPTVQQFGFVAFSLLAGCVVHQIVSRTDPNCIDTTSNAATLTSRLFCNLGKYSYAIYLFHMPVIHAVKALPAPESPLARLTAQLWTSALVSYALAWLSWHLYEKHWLRWKPRY